MAKILIVDDSKSMRQMVQFTLKNSEHELLEADDGDVALELAKKQSFDLILTDINMPRMDGVTLTQELRALSGHQKTPIMILTTESSDEKKVIGRKYGANGWIIKPFTPEKLLTVVKKIVG